MREQGVATNNIREYMNGMSTKQFVYEQVSAIANAIRTEFYDRKAIGLTINTKSEEGKAQLSARIAEIANKTLIKKKKDDLADVTQHDVWLYKKCCAEEYTDRTGKCAWGFKELRQRWGFDPNTALELEEV